jgi:hypothetical protein
MKPQDKIAIDNLRIEGKLAGELLLFQISPNTVRSIFAGIRSFRNVLLYELRQTRDTDTAPQNEEVLLGRLPYAVVEGTSGIVTEKSILCTDLSAVRKGVPKLWKQGKKILLQGMLHRFPQILTVRSSRLRIIPRWR